MLDAAPAEPPPPDDADIESAGARARLRAHRAVCAAAADALRPEPVLPLPEWCARNIDMPLSSPLPGPMDAGAVPAALPIYRAWTDPAVREIIIRGPTQTLKSQLMICALLYEAATFPGPFAVYQPDKALARRFSQTRIPEVAAHTRLAPYFQRTARGSESDGGTIAERHFPGGTCKIVGVGDRSALVSDPIRIAFIDEINLMAGVDVVGMTNDRLSTFPDRRRFIASSPGDFGVCAITAEFQRGDQREWNARCPHDGCGELQPLEWERVHFHPRDPDSARYECAGCGALWDDDELLRANRAGEFVAAQPFAGIASFALNALANPMLSLSHLAREWIDAYQHMEHTGDLLKIKTFTRSRMALPWKDKDRRLDAAEIQRTTAVKYPPGGRAPDGVLAAVLAVDTQDDRLEAEVSGWALAPIGHDDLKMRRALRDTDPPAASDEPRWTLKRFGLGYHVLVGDPSAPQIWAQLNELYNTPIRLTDGAKPVAIRPSVMFVDSGGHYTDRVRDFVAGRGPGRENIFPVKGANTNDAPLVRATRSRDMLERYANTLIFIGTFGAKEIVYRHLAASRHLPSKTKLYNYPRGGGLNYTDRYFDGLTAEEKINRRDRNGQVRAAWVCADGKANEPLDLAVYGYAAIRHLGGVDYLLRRQKLIGARIAAR